MRNAIFRNERGATLVHVGFMLAGLIAFSAFVTDYGIMWVSRRQAQNAADAAALSGVVALAYNGFNDRTDTGPAKVSAINAGNLNNVWGGAAAITAAAVTFPACPDGSNACIRAEVYRDASHGNALPSLFGRMVGVSSQATRASAVAEVVSADSPRCLKPWALIDRWQENWPLPGMSTHEYDEALRAGTVLKFDKYKSNGDLDPSVTSPDFYQAGPASSGGTGFNLFPTAGAMGEDFGLPITMKAGNANLFNSGWFQALDIPAGCTGGACYNAAIKGCFSGFSTDPALPTSIITFETGDMVGPTDQGVYTDSDSLCHQDALAGRGPSHWTPTGPVWDGPPQTPYDGARVVTIPMLSPEDVSTTKNGKASARIQNFVGMFIHCPGDPADVDFSGAPPPGTVIGHLMPAAGDGWGPPLGSNNSFLVKVGLIR